MKKSILLWLMVLCVGIVSAQTIEINTVEDLSALATNNESQNGYVGQTIDLKADLTITKVWRPIGTRDYPFRGTFKGNGHIISGLGAIAGTDGVGLFGYVGEKGVVEEVGIGTGHIKTMKNDECQYVGALVGRNNGTIRRCWNMATLEVNAIHVGGLVGQNSGTMEDCYNAGPILKAIDYIGGLVGTNTNTGAIRYCYNIGYAANGYGVVAQNTGTINDCYYDRQLYIQNPDAGHQDPTGVTAMEKSADMYTIFSARSAWQQMGDNYPILKVFQNQDAAIVSVASIDLTNKGDALADNHMNLLTSDFIVNSKNGVHWAVTSPLMEQWVYPDAANANQWRVAFPCRPTDVIMQVSKNGNVREVYAFPKPVPDFIPGKFAADSFVVCQNTTLYFSTIKLKGEWNEAPSGGAGDYHVQLVLNYLDENGEVTKKDTLIDALSWGGYIALYNSGSWTPSEPGHYTLQRYAADEQCHPELISAEGIVPIFVPAELTPGKITIESDTLCDINQTITITSKEPAICEGTKVLYYWKMNNVVLPNQNGLELVDFLMPTNAGPFAFTRYAYNNACVDSVHAIPSDTVTVVVYNKFDEGSIINREIIGCTVQDVLDQLSVISEQDTVRGGKKPYSYRWMMVKDDGTAQTISGDQPSLDLSQAGLEDAHKYVIYREVKDSYCQTDSWIKSKGQVEIQIYSEITGGEIENKKIPADCIMPGDKGSIHVRIASKTPAQTIRGDIKYNWYMVVNDDTANPIDLEQNTESLDYNLDYGSVQNNATYTFFRTAKNENCNGEEVRSDGQTELLTVIATNVDSTIFICESMFENGQYTFYYPNAENPRQTNIFYKDDLQIWEFNDKLESGCEPKVKIRPVLTLAPKIHADDVSTICQDGDAGTLTIYFEMLEGEANTYNIELSESLRPFFDGEKYISGTIPTVTAGNSGAITVRCQRIGISGGDKIMNLQVAKLIDGQELCYSAMSEIVLNVTQGGYVLDKYGKVLFIDNNPKHPTDPKFIAYQWYKNGQKIEGATGQYYHEDGASLNGSYFADLFYFNGGREMILRTCPIEMENGTKREQENATDSVSKRLENSQIIIQRGDAEYTILGSEL